MAKRTLYFWLLIATIWPAAARAQESLQTAQALYASASYDEALAMLDRLQKQPLLASDAVELQQRRALCLVALGRTAEAEGALAELVKTQPTYRMSDSATAPRVRALFKDVRSKLLSGLVLSVYNDARVAYDQQQWTQALAGFQEVQALAVDPDLPPADARGVQEYKVLADGFAKLADAAAHPPAPAPVPTPAAVAPPAPIEPDYTKVFDSSDPNVVAPLTLRQDMPKWLPNGQALPRAGVLEVIITASGIVERATLTKPMAPAYDHQVLDATKNWKYQPATVDGHPVRYRKQIRINFQ